MQVIEGMEQEIDLPPMPAIRVLQTDPPSALSESHQRRKRPRVEYDLTTSSDPALFSSDDHAPTAENYVSKRRKEKWRGTWWGEKVNSGASNTSSNGTKRKFTRNFDSGVWMGSEATDTSLEDDLLDELRSASRPAANLNPPVIGEGGLNDSGKDAALLEDVEEHEVPNPQSDHVTPEAARNSSLHAAVGGVIDHCLEAGDENVDLSSMSLDSVPNESLRRLRILTTHTTIQDIPPSQDGYSPIEAALRLYLSNNAIVAFPSEILNLTSLRVLSLRQNRLTDIPPAVARLPHLEQFNIAANQLQHLPYEMLRLYDREDFSLTSTPNPFSQPQSPISLNFDLENPSFTKDPLLVAQSTRTYFHADGANINNGATSLQALSSRVPCLLELALRKCKDLPDLAEIEDWCSTGGGPSNLRVPLALAQEASKYGDLECTVCGRSFIVPMVQWMEWWNVPTRSKRLLNSAPLRIPSTTIPFLRQGCSWACVKELES